MSDYSDTNVLYMPRGVAENKEDLNDIVEYAACLTGVENVNLVYNESWRDIDMFGGITIESVLENALNIKRRERTVLDTHQYNQVDERDVSSIDWDRRL